MLLRTASFLTVSFCHYLLQMVFSKEEKIIIQNDYEEKWWSANRIWKDRSSKTGLTYPYKGFWSILKIVAPWIEKKVLVDIGQTTEENNDLNEEMICSQDEALHIHLALRIIAEQTGISRSPIIRMRKRRIFHQFKRIKTPKIDYGCRNGR